MNKRIASLTAFGLSGALLLSACGGEDTGLADGPDEDEQNGAAECEPQAEPPETGEADAPEVEIPESGEDADEIEIGLIPWEEAIAVTHLWEVILEDQGYDVTITDLDVAPLFQGMAEGDIDLFLDTWLPQTHGDYWEDYGDDLENIGTWYDNAILTLTVPEYMEDINSIPDLQEHADEIDNQLVGIESGAGLTRTTQDHAIPGYCLDDVELVESSTGAMLAELDAAYAAEEPIAVTLWRPHPAYAQYDLKDLEDPEGMMGGAETLHSVGRDGFAAEYPEFASWLSEFELDDDELSTLQVLTLEDYEDEPDEGAREWLSDNPEFLERTLGDEADELDY